METQIPKSGLHQDVLRGGSSIDSKDGKSIHQLSVTNDALRRDGGGQGAKWYNSGQYPDYSRMVFFFWGGG